MSTTTQQMKKHSLIFATLIISFALSSCQSWQGRGTLFGAAIGAGGGWLYNKSQKNSTDADMRRRVATGAGIGAAGGAMYGGHMQQRSPYQQNGYNTQQPQYQQPQYRQQQPFQQTAQAPQQSPYGHYQNGRYVPPQTPNYQLPTYSTPSYQLPTYQVPQ